jgi:undecaprenyl-diphosphatase
MKSPRLDFGHAAALPLAALALLLTLAPVAAALASSEAAAAPPPERAAMSATQAVVLGVVEGLTEYLPVSSTAHLLLTQRLMGIGVNGGQEKGVADSYGIVIQAGAILAVVGLYFGRVWSLFTGLAGRDPVGRRLLINLVAAFLPAAVIGLSFNKAIKHYLFGMEPIVAAWFIGGLAILWMSWRRRGSRRGLGGGLDYRDDLDDLGWRQALVIGFLQALAMWPGVSRSLITIVGGLVVGLSLPAAVEFSFLLGLVTLAAATGYEGLKEGGQIIALYGWLNPLLGFLASFISGVAAIKWMVGYLNRHGLAIFGYYRVALALAVGAALYLGLL